MSKFLEFLLTTPKQTVKINGKEYLTKEQYEYDWKKAEKKRKKEWDRKLKKWGPRGGPNINPDDGI